MTAPAAAARRYLETLFRPALGRGFVELRALRAGACPVRRFWPIVPDALTSIARSAIGWADDRDAYVGVLPRVRRGGKAGDVQAGGWMWVDVDAGTDGVAGAEALLARAALPDPAMVVASGRGVHAYWRVSPAHDLANAGAKLQFCNLLRRLARQIGSSDSGAHADPACADAARVLRVPGTWNRKQIPPLPVHLLTCDPTSEAYPIDWWGSHLPALPLPPTRAGSMVRCPSPPIARLQGLRAWATRPIPEGERHRSLAAAAAWLRRDVGLGDDDVRSLILTKAAASPGSHPISDAEIEGILRWA
jgi:hypothetical protein